MKISKSVSSLIALMSLYKTKGLMMMTAAAAAATTMMTIIMPLIICSFAVLHILLHLII